MGEIITATYYDANNGAGNSAEPNYTATADCTNPVISDVNYTEQIIGSWQVITVNTNEPTGVRVILGMSCGASDIVVESRNLQLSHTLTFDGMEEGTYYFKIEATDRAGNMTVDDNGGVCYQFTRRDIHVPDDYRTIQEAIDAAKDTDVIRISEGTYYESIDLKDKDILVRSTDPNDYNVVERTIIDGNGAKTTVANATNVQWPKQSQVSGFTITGGNNGVYANYLNELAISNCIINGNNNWGVECNDSSAIVLQNCIISNNANLGVHSKNWVGIVNCSIYGSDKGIYIKDGTASITNSFISNNNYEGIYCEYGSIGIKNSSIYANGSKGIDFEYGGLYIKNSSIHDNGDNGVYCKAVVITITSSFIYGNNGGLLTDQNVRGISVTNCTIVNNNNFGITNNSQLVVPTIYNCILWNNNDDLIDCNATYSCIQDGDIGTGNISSDPCFVDDANNDFHINIYSPCINAGNPNGDYNDQNDIDGQARVIGRCVDIGADEVDFNAPEPNGQWWKLDETGGVTAYDSVDDNDGTFNGNDPCWVTGHIGGAVDLNGVSDYFSVSSLDNSYYATSTFTVAGWFKTSQSTGIQTIVGNWSQWYYSPGPNMTFYSGWQVLVENNKVVARFATNCPSIGLSNIIGTKDVNDGNWHHFALVHPNYPSTSNTILYVDGQSEGTPAVRYYCNSNTKFRIGDGSYTVSGGPVTLKGGPFCGMIDDVMIFHRTLTADEVWRLYAFWR